MITKTVLLPCRYFPTILILLLFSCDSSLDDSLEPKQPVVTKSKWSKQEVVTGFSFPIETIFFIDETTGFVGGHSGIFKTIDGGETWNKLKALPETHVFEIFFIDLNNGFVATTGGLMKTTDGGETWDLTSFQHPLTSVFFISPTTGFIGSSSDPGDLSSIKLYRTTDGGANWNVVLSENNLDGVRDIRFINTATGYARMGGHIIKTVDSGVNWEHSFSNADPSGATFGISSLALTNSVLYAVLWIPNEDTFFGAIWKSENGVSWNSAGPGPVTSIAFSPSGYVGFAVGSARGTPPNLFLSRDHGATWDKEESTRFIPVAVAVPSDNVAYVVCMSGVLLKYSDK